MRPGAGTATEAVMEHFTLDRAASAELEAKGSRFIAHLVPLAAFDDRLAALRIENRKASHHVTASRKMVANGQIEEQASDDGEPAGTSGMPALRVLMGAGLVDTAVIIVRYFGGTKLGTGGLARAYSGAAARAVEAARLRPWFRLVRLHLRCDFATMSDVERIIGAPGLTVISREFTAEGAEFLLEGPEQVIAAADWPRGVVAEAASISPPE